MDRLLKSVFALASTMLIAACGSLGTPAPSTQEEPAATLVPTEEPTSAPTEVAADAPAEVPTEEPTVLPEPTLPADDTVEAIADGEFALAPNQISLNTQDLAVAWQAVVVPGTLYDESMPPGPMGLPAHLEILFGENTNPAAVRPGDPIMYIIPVNRYRKLWNEAGNSAVTETIDRIQQLNFVLPSPGPTSGYPALPFEQIGGVNDLAVQVGRAVPQNELNTTSATQDGYRLVGRWTQDAKPVTNVGLRYVYQGFTNDGVYLVSFWWPVTTSMLPDDVSEVPGEQMDRFNADPMTSVTAVAQDLNSLSADQWRSDLATLDAVVASLEIEGMTPAGLLDQTWAWTRGPVQPGSSEIVDVPDPESYQVTYSSDGTLTYLADCTSGSSTYVLNKGGMTGGMLVEPGSLTAADCGSDSLAAGFINSLAAAQDYGVWAGGNELQLVLPAGGGVLLLRKAGAPTPAGGEARACVTGTITSQEPVDLPEDSLVQVQLQDTSLADAKAIVLGEQIITNPGQLPRSFEVCYDPDQIQSNHTYTMSVRITNGDGKLWFINDTAIPVITRGSPTENVEAGVIPVGG
jgi:uncharacterized lipoprotein YbaY